MREKIVDLNAFKMTKNNMQNFAEMLLYWHPKMFKGYASALSLFAQYIRQQGIDGIHPHLIEASSEKFFASQREVLEDVFDCQVVENYGSRETGIMAYQCNEAGFHVFADTHYLEIVADETVVEPGKPGDVVVTPLYQFAMPFIRYKNGDIAIYKKTACSCGRKFPCLQEVVGRTYDILVSTEGEWIHSAFFDFVFFSIREVIRYQVYQINHRHFEIRLVCDHEVDETWLNNLRGKIQARLGESMQIDFQVVDEIKLTPAGKHRCVISNVEADFSSLY
jgi:phenylacetate-CoA ligase